MTKGACRTRGGMSSLCVPLLFTTYRSIPARTSDSYLISLYGSKTNLQQRPMSLSMFSLLLARILTAAASHLPHCTLYSVLIIDQLNALVVRVPHPSPSHSRCFCTTHTLHHHTTHHIMHSVSHSSTGPRTDGTASSGAHTPLTVNDSTTTGSEEATVPVTTVSKETSEHETPFRPLACSTPVAQPAQRVAATTCSAAAAAATAAANSPTHTAAAGGGDSSPVATTSVIETSAFVRDVKMVIEGEKSAFMSEAAAARVEALLVSIVLDEEKQWADKEHDWEDKYSKLEQILVQQQKEAGKCARQTEADIEGLSATIESNLVAIQSGFPPGMFGTPAPPIAALSSFATPLPPAPALADKLAELTMLKKQLEALKEENKRMHGQYDSLHEIYSKQRQAIEHLQTENEEMTGSLTAVNERYANLRQHAQTKLDEASEEVESLRTTMVRMEKQHESDTLLVRMRLRQRDADVEALEQTVNLKKKQVVELKKICHELIVKAGEADE